jgi:trigger factor
MPVVDLRDHDSLRVPREAVKIEDQQIQDALEDLRKRHAVIEPVSRKAKKGDIISGSVSAKAGDLSIFAADDIEFRVVDEAMQSLPGFIDIVTGLKKGDEVTKTAEAPAEHSDENIAGKTMTYVVKVNEVKEENLPKLDDDFAKEAGDYETLLALRAKIREDIEKAANDANLRSYETAVVDALADQAKIDYPAVMVEHEIDHILQDQANIDPRDPRSQLLYLQRMNKSEEEVRESVREEATTRLKRSLVLSHFAEAENINVEDADVDAELESMASSAGEQGDFVRQLFGGDEARETLARNLHTRRTLERLVEIAGQEAKKAPAKKPAKARRTTPRKAEA